MLAESEKRIGEELDTGALVLDVGGWAEPLGRADWVLDLMPYETRARSGSEAAERFSAERWIVRDICDREPWPFADRQFDFAVCSHTLEDVRDPVWVCAELTRVARAGYVEVPSRVEEQCYGVHGPWVGWSHHHWLCDVGERSIEFVFKSAVLQGREAFRFPAGFVDALAPAERVQQLWWREGFDFAERILIDTEEHDRYLGSFVAERLPAGARRNRPRARVASWLHGRLRG